MRCGTRPMNEQGWSSAVFRMLRVTTYLMAIVSTVSCGELDGSTDRPDVTIAPVAPMQFVFHNTSASPLYVDWSAGRAPVRILRDGTELAVDTGCAPLCHQTCGCMACAAPEHRVLKIDPGAHIQLEWTPVHHVFHSCQDSPACSCAEPWPVTAGTYAVHLAAAKAVKGGTPSLSDPGMLDGADPDWSAATCLASTDFVLEGGAKVAVAFNCN